MTTAAPAKRLRVASYNIHDCVGGDGRRDPARVAAVLREIDADIIGLQEVDARPGATSDVDADAVPRGRRSAITRSPDRPCCAPTATTATPCSPAARCSTSGTST